MYASLMAVVVPLLAVAGGSFSPVPDAVTPLSVREVRLLDRPGELFRRSLERRVFSERAKGPVYEEAENAFATHWDDADGHTGWQNEYWGKTMLCVAGAVMATGDCSLSEWCVRKAHHLIDTYQWPNGYLSTYGREDFLRDNPDSSDHDRHWCFNIWGRKYTLWALIEIYRATGDVKCLDAAEKMADHLVAQLRRLGVPIDQTGSWAGISSLSILRPLLELQRLRPKAEYMGLADSMVRATDVSGRPRPTMNVIFDALSSRPVETWFERPSFLAKSYEMMSYFEGVADYYRLTGNPRMLEAVSAFWTHLVEEELNPMRSVGYFDHFVGSRRHVNGMSELCDVVHWIRLNRELWLLTGETKYLDCIEESFYNAFLSGVSPDGSWGAHIIRSHGTRHLYAPPQTGMKLHQCCPDNMLRAFYDWSATVADMSADGAYELNLYSDVDCRLKDAEISVRGGYPVADGFRVRIRCPHGGRIRFRVPHWAKELKIDGIRTGFANGRCECDFPPGEHTFAVVFDMSPRIIDSLAPDVEDIVHCVTNDMAMAKGGYTTNAMTWLTDEMRGLVRTKAAAQVMRGPLVLAKGRTAGTCREETFDFETFNRRGFRASLEGVDRMAENASAWGVWKLTFEKGSERHSVLVGDFWSVSSFNDPQNWFSVWF